MFLKGLLSAALAFSAIAMQAASALDSAAEVEIRGKIVDAETGEEIIGAAVMVKEQPDLWAMSGLDGSFTVKVDAGSSRTLLCSLIGYKDMEVVYAGGDEALIISLVKDSIVLDGAVVAAENHGKTEASARGIEKAAMNVVNVMSARAMELSPDVTVANVIKRMSGKINSDNFFFIFEQCFFIEFFYIWIFNSIYTLCFCFKDIKN